MELAALIIGIAGLAFGLIVLFCHLSTRDDLEDRIRDLRTTTKVLENKITRLQGQRTVAEIAERVPLREKCPCGHHAFTHSHNGCNATVMFGHMDCACKGTQEQVLYTPHVMQRLG